MPSILPSRDGQAALADIPQIVPTTIRHADRDVGHERRQTTTRVIAVVATVVGVAYLIWRATSTLNPDALVLSWTLLALEAHAVLGLAIFTFSLWHVSPQQMPVSTRLPDGEVAVVITTYDEPVEILLPVVHAALRVDGPHETWVLDDGNRPEIRELADELGARYLARADNTHAKAGNLNAALALIEADYMAVLDADHVPHPAFLTRTLPYFVDPEIALVQTPQDFYNEQSFEHVGGDANVSSRRRSFTEQSLFYRVIQPAKNRWQSAFWCGTGAVLRTQALRDVGGVATESITEDLQTTIRLHRAGWKSRYHNEVLARGLAAPTADEYLLQRRRWAMGAIQTLRAERPLTDRDLTVEQRLSYFATITAWFDAIRVLGLMLLPPAVLLTGSAPIAAPLTVFAAWFVVSFALQQFALFRLGRGHLRPIASMMFDVVRLEATMVALYMGYTGRKISFQVTPKGRTSTGARRVRIPRLLVTLAVIYLLTFSWYLATVAGLTRVSYGVPGVAHGAAFWLVVGAGVVWLAIDRIRALDYAPERRSSHRHELHASAKLGHRPARLADVSLTGARVDLLGEADALLSGDMVQLTVDRDEGVDSLAAKVIAVDRRGDGRWTVRLEFVDGQFSDRAMLTDGLFHADQRGPKVARRRPVALGVAA